MKKAGQYYQGVKNDLIDKSSADADPLSDSIKGLKICVVGAGFVGTVTAAGFAKFGHDVVCIEKDLKRLSILKSGRLPFYERDLEELVRNGLSSGSLSFESELEKSVEGMKAVFLTVGTPSSKTGRADLTGLYRIISMLSKKMNSSQIFVLKSTVPVGTAESIKRMLNQNGSQRGIAVISNPEFLREGNAVYDFFNPHRIVIGGDSEKAVDTISNIYKMGMAKSVPIFTTNNETAEMIKYASNVFLATKVGLINEFARLCDTMGVDAIEVARIIGADPRIGPKFLNPGPGWGGSCLPKDLQEFIGLADSLGVPLFIPKAVREANLYQSKHVVSKVKGLLGDLKGVSIGAFGLTFKADTSDLRESPAIPILSKLIESGAKIRAFDPAANGDFDGLFPHIDRMNDPYKAAEDADCILILTEWSDFRLLDWRRIGAVLNKKNIIDTRSILAPEHLKQYGFNYVSIGHNGTC